MKWVNYFVNGLLVLLIGGLIIRKGLDWSEAKKTEGLRVPEIVLQILGEDNLWHEQKMDLSKGRKTFIFWATDCVPCTAELFKLKKQIEMKLSDVNDLIAIASFEPSERVFKVVKERGYNFKVAVDPDGVWARQFSVRATPTKVIVKDGLVESISTGFNFFGWIESLENQNKMQVSGLVLNEIKRQKKGGV